MLKKLALSGVGLLLLASPLFVSADIASQIASLQAQIAQLTQILAQLLAQKSPPTSSATCFVPTYDLYAGRTDAETNGEVSKLQLWLKATEYFPDAQGTGFYGDKTAAAVMRWQKAHGMDFVTLKSGVGKMTRAKISESCGQSAVKTGWQTYKGDGFEFQYPSDTFVLFPITRHVPRPLGLDTDPSYSGVKIISIARAKNVGQPGCAYGGSGLTSVCSANAEAGIAFYVADKPAQDLSSLWEDGVTKKTVNVNGKLVVQHSYGAEGDGSDDYYIPLSSNRTLMVQREYLYPSDFPSPALFNQILSTLTFTNTSGQMPEVTAYPTSGPSPLKVTFQFKNLEENGSYVLDTGDESGVQFWVKNSMACISGASASSCASVITHSYYAGSGPSNGNTFKVHLSKYDAAKKSYATQVAIKDITISVTHD